MNMENNMGIGLEWGEGRAGCGGGERETKWEQNSINNKIKT